MVGVEGGSREMTISPWPAVELDFGKGEVAIVYDRRHHMLINNG